MRSTARLPLFVHSNFETFTLNAPAKPAPLIDPTFLFRFEIAIHRHACSWTSSGLDLPPQCRVPCFAAMAGRREFADVRLAWEPAAIGFVIEVPGKQSPPWCRDSRLEDSDGFHLWIDTRCSPGIHRATQYCHRFLFMPTGSGGARDQPMTGLMPINRARQNPKSPPPGSIQVYAKMQTDGYRLSGRIAAAAMTGFDSVQYPRLGLYYAVIDRELGSQTLALSQEFPVAEDPSLWGEAVLAAQNSGK
jgi:hypothetical protein